MKSRELILQRLRAARWAPSAELTAVCPESQVMPGDPEVFAERATAAGAQVEKVDSLTEVQIRLAELIKEGSLQKIIVADEAAVTGIDWEQITVETGCEIQFSSGLSGDDYRHFAVSADLGITGCQYAISETGTVVLKHSHVNERLVSHAPNHYVCIVKREQILNNRFALAAAIEGDQSAAWTMVTGVSRTADVALQVVLGMHGPRKVTIFIVD